MERLGDMDCGWIIEAALALENETVGVRRHLHADPELSYHEYRTADYIRGLLDEAGMAWRPVAGTGTLVEIGGTASNGSGRTVVLRADIDALPVHEQVDVPWRSGNEGVMHACGHDMHTAVLMGVLKILSANRHRFGGRILGLFQPGEERNPGGASLVLAENPFEGYNVAAVIGEHVDVGLPVGSFGFREGCYMAASDELRFRVKGVGGHGAMRHLLRDPVPAAARLVLELRRMADETDTPASPVVLSVGRVVADGATNVVPDEVRMEGTLRTFDEILRRSLHGGIIAAAEAAGREWGVEIETDISHGYPTVVNDRALTALGRSCVAEIWGADRIVDLDLRTTSEDFGFYSQRYASLFYRLGAGAEGVDSADRSPMESGLQHSPHFCPNERALFYGMVQMTALAMKTVNEI